jgi:putative heme-binding domain-containing protein
MRIHTVKHLAFLGWLAGMVWPVGLGAEERVPWTTSRIVGSPEPPPKFKTSNAYPRLKFDQPTVVTSAPGSDRIFLCERFGKLFSFPDDPAVEAADLLIDLKTELTTLPDDDNVAGVDSVYGLAFHPEYPAKPLVYVTYTLRPKDRQIPLLDGTRVSEFRVAQEEPPRLIPESERIVITWREGGHNGGCLKFGPDGYLYITTGDATPPNPPDELRAGQDVGNLLSALLRIDVDHRDEGRPYRVPEDNPFVALAGARPEIWAYGFRNPWKMSFDRETGELWVGDVGWELWEMVYHIRKGGNYGWSVMEGPQPVYPDDPIGPTPILPPSIALSHAESSSVTGGFVYRGTKFPELRGRYIFGDFDTRGVWAADFQEGVLQARETLTPPEHRVVGFGEKNDGELLVVDFETGTLHRFERNVVEQDAREFPTRLSETGLFEKLTEQVPAAGVYEFEITAPMWSDGATARRFAAFPGESGVRWYPQRRPIPGLASSTRLYFPENGVLAKTITLETTSGPRHVETQILHHDGRFWQGYTYRWNDRQTDAELVPSGGDTTFFTIPDADAPEGQSQLRWTFHGRQQCLRCHNPWNEHALAFNIPQLSRGTQAYPDQLQRLENLRLLSRVREENGQTFNWNHPTEPLASLSDESVRVEQQARTYLHVNCAHCHQQHAGGTTTIDLRYDLPLDRTNLIGHPPMQGTFGFENAKLVEPGQPWESILHYRLVVTGAGHMPHVGAERVDPQGASLVERWIREMVPAEFPRHAELRKHDLSGPPTGALKALIASLLESTPGRLLLEAELRLGRVGQETREFLIQTVLEHEDPTARRFFTRWLPESARQPTLGPNINPEWLLAAEGDPARGERLFFNQKLLQCARCHKVGDRGGEIGPALGDVGKRLKPEEILENILEPSKTITPKFQTWIAITDEGKIHAGLLLKEDAEAVELVNAKGDKIRLRRDRLEALESQRTSLMPDQQLRDLTREQAADLLAYLRSLR